MNEKKEDNELKELLNLAVECMGVAVTITDTKGIVLYYNKHAAKILDRKPEYIGKDSHSHHKKAATNEKLSTSLVILFNMREILPNKKRRSMLRL